MLKIIDGDNEGPLVKPQLVMKDGKVHMQVKLGPYSATMPLPEHLATKTEDQLKDFFDEVVPVMVRNLIEMRTNDRRKARRAKP